MNLELGIILPNKEREGGREGRRREEGRGEGGREEEKGEGGKKKWGREGKGRERKKKEIGREGRGGKEEKGGRRRERNEKQYYNVEISQKSYSRKVSNGVSFQNTRKQFRYLKTK